MDSDLHLSSLIDPRIHEIQREIDEHVDDKERAAFERGAEAMQEAIAESLVNFQDVEDGEKSAYDMAWEEEIPDYVAGK